jgi:hypothetical protein
MNDAGAFNDIELGVAVLASLMDMGGEKQQASVNQS